MAEEVRRWRGEEKTTLIEHPEEGEHQSNHYAESGVNVIKGLVRTIKSGIEEKLGHELEATHPLLPWVIEQSAQLRNRFQLGPDGRTGVERLRGRAISRPIFHVGEKVLYLPLKPARDGDYGAKFEYGVYLGCMNSNGQAIIGTASGTLRCRTVKPLAENLKWDADFARAIQGTPWDPRAQQADEGIGIRIDMPPKPTGEDVVTEEQLGSRQVRRMILKKEYFTDRFGYTAGCPGCKALRLNRPQGNHSEQCRAQIERALQQTPMVQM